MHILCVRIFNYNILFNIQNTKNQLVQLNSYRCSYPVARVNIYCCTTKNNSRLYLAKY